jgi:hypothetical protein
LLCGGSFRLGAVQTQLGAESYLALLSRSAMRVCHPGPVAFQRAMTSAGKRSEISCRGLEETGLPPLFTFARESISVVIWGNSSYSFAEMTCASTFERSDFKERRDPRFFALIGFPHTKYVSRGASRRIADDHQAVTQQAVPNDASLAVVLSNILNLKGDAFENQGCISKIESTIRKSSFSLSRIKRDFHRVNVYTITVPCKREILPPLRRNPARFCP